MGYEGNTIIEFHGEPLQALCSTRIVRNIVTELPAAHVIHKLEHGFRYGGTDIITQPNIDVYKRQLQH